MKQFLDKNGNYFALNDHVKVIASVHPLKIYSEGIVDKISHRGKFIYLKFTKKQLQSNITHSRQFLANGPLFYKGYTWEKL